MTIAQGQIDFAAPALPKQQTRLDADERAAQRLGTFLTLPTQILLAFIVIFPLLMELYISLSSWTPLDGRNWLFAYRYWAGLDNYLELVTNVRFWQSIGRTLLMMVICVPIELLLGLGLALLFAGEFRGKRLFYSIMLMPMMVVPSVAGYMFFMLFQSGGPINDILATLSASPGLNRLAQQAKSRARRRDDRRRLAVDAAHVPHPARRFARRSGRSIAYGDAAGRGSPVALSLDRAAAHPAHPFDRARHPTIEIFKVFDTLYIMTAGGPGVSTETISVYIYKVTMEELQWSYVATIALVILIVLSALAAPAIKRFAPAR